jgi:hypothetical protein
MARGQWVYAGGRAGKKPSFHEKLAITAACDRLITDVLSSRYLWLSLYRAVTLDEAVLVIGEGMHFRPC